MRAEMVQMRPEMIDLRKSAVGLRGGLKASQDNIQQVLVTNRAAAGVCLHFGARLGAGCCCVTVNHWIG
jgi:hypothetical protein